ncbi:hypothetical protein [Flavobacterium sp. J27]|uniref:hypothetical protein n=1 Tax=Flavobacterium sp. J27 TaxID=2060419 RepID=UPI00102F5FE4|nr:hypothetical protein [Flavobacterium sp. J27]
MLLVSFNIEQIEEQWKEATFNGIRTFYKFYKSHFNGILQINIHNIFWFPVDTKDVIINYTIIRVLCYWFQLDYLPILCQPQYESLFFLNNLQFKKNQDNRVDFLIH